MSKMRKIVCLFLAGILLILTASCGSNSENEKNTGPAGTYAESLTPGKGDRYVVSGSKFHIVFGEDETGGEKLNSAAVLLYNLVWEKLGKRMELMPDKTTPEQEFEILIGDTDRAGNVDTGKLTYYDYGWTFDGAKVRIYGGSPEALENAVTRFVEKYLDMDNHGLVITKGEALTAFYSYPYSSVSLYSADIQDYVIAAKFGFDSAARAVAAGFGRLCGVKMTIDFVKDGSPKPTGEKYIYVGFDETEDLNMVYQYSDGSLRFIGNGLTGSFNQLERLVKAFFDEEFFQGDSETINVENITEKKMMPKLENMQFADSDFIKVLDNNFEATKQEILTSASDYTVAEGGKVYYVSNSTGNDANDGLSEATPWKTLEKVNSATVPAGSVILFKRGDEWNRQGRLYSKSNVTFSAYGEGEKPLFANYIDASAESDWTKVGDNLYVYSGSYVSGTPYDYDGKDISADYPKLDIPGSYLISTDFDGNDIGNIIFNDDEGWGVKIMKRNSSETSVHLGTVPTGFGMLTHNSIPFVDQNDLSQHLEFYHNSKESRLYLYCEGGNPAKVFHKIKLVMEGYGLFGGTGDVCSNVVVDNLAFKYYGCHGISLNQSTNYTIRNCEVGWCGGSIQGYTWGGRTEPTRFGEGIQNWGNCDGFHIVDNYLHQIYDGATSSQQSSYAGLTRVVMQNIEVTGNCYENNTCSIEFWMNLTPAQGNNENFKFKNWDISSNQIRATGHGFGRTRPVTPDGEGGEPFADSNGWPKPLYENVNMTDNAVWGSASGLVAGLGWRTDMYNVANNIIVHEYGMLFGIMARDFDNRAEWDVGRYVYDTETVDLMLKKKVLGQNLFYYTYDNKNK